MSMLVKNPTGKSKAIRIAGGHAIVAPGKSEKIDAVLTADEKVKYEAAGLVFGVGKEVEKPNAKTKKRIGLEAQAAKLEVPFEDETSDDDLIGAIKMAKDDK